MCPEPSVAATGQGRVGSLPANMGARLRGELGMSLPEVLVALFLTLILMLGGLAMLDDTKREHVRVLEVASAEAMGRATLDYFVSEASVAGFDPLGMSFAAVPQGDACGVQLLADLDEDGIVGTAGESNENVSYEFRDPDNDGVYELRRGVDLNADGDFTDDSESVDSLATVVVPIDIDGNGTDDPFLTFDAAPPSTTSVTIAFGLHVKTTLVIRQTNSVRRFVTTISLRNRQ